MRMDPPSTAPKLRPPRRAELLADNREFVALAGELLVTFRKTADKSCAVCGAKQGIQHKQGAVCFRLTTWRAGAQYKRAST